MYNKKYYIYTKQFNMKKMKRFIYVFISNSLDVSLFVGGDGMGIFLTAINYARYGVVEGIDPFNFWPIDLGNPLAYFYYFSGKVYIYTFENYIWCCTISIIAWLLSYIVFWISFLIIN